MGMLDVGDVVKGEPDRHAGVKGPIKAVDVNWCSEIVVELDNLADYRPVADLKGIKERE